MRDYMTALHDRFRVTSSESENQEQTMKAALNTLHEELSREQQKLLLRLQDAENAFREERELDSFISGFRLADGIHRELGDIPAFSLIAEEEERARRVFEQERKPGC